MTEDSSSNSNPLSLFGMLGAACLLLAFAIDVSPQTGRSPVGVTNSQFNLKLDAGAIVNLRRAEDRVDTDYIQAGQRLADVFLRYRGKDGAWISADTTQLSRSGVGTFASSPDGRSYTATYQILYIPPGSNTGPANTRATPMPVFELRVQYTIEEHAVVWTVAIQNVGNAPRQIEDLAIPLPIASFTPSGTNRPITILNPS